MNVGAYLAGTVALVIAILACTAIGVVVRRRLVPAWSGPPAWLVVSIGAVAAAILLALLLGSFGLLHGWLWFAFVTFGALLLWRFGRPPSPAAGTGPAGMHPGRPKASGDTLPMTGIALAIAAAAFGMFAAGSSLKLGTGMTVFDTNWYHGPLAVDMIQSGNTLTLHQLTPAFLSWFYPQNSELIHGLGIMLYGNDLLSPFINLAWFAGCLVAAWSIGRAYGAAPVSLAGTALILGSAVLGDQAGEARNDIVGTFFVLTGVAVLLNAGVGRRGIGSGPALVVAVAAGLAAGTKLNFLPPAVVLIAAAIWMAGPGSRRRVVKLVVAGAFLGGGYWYLRNLIHSGNPLPWIRHLGPLTLPGPDQEMGGRQAGSVLGYLGNTEVVRHWFLPGLRQGLGNGWPVLFLLALAGPVICLWKRSDPVRRAGAAVALSLFFSWLVAPTSASGSPGVPGGFFTGLRYLAPALAVGMALLGSGIGNRNRDLSRILMGLFVLLAPFAIRPADSFPDYRYWLVAAAAAVTFWMAAVLLVMLRQRVTRGESAASGRIGPGAGVALIGLTVLALALVGYPVQRHYFDQRYTSADYTTKGLAATFKWARGISGERIGTTASREYPLFGTMLGNHVGYIGEPRSHGGFVKPETCPAFRRAVNRGDYRYLVLAVDRIEPRKKFPPEAGWVVGDPAARQIYRGEGTAVYELAGPLDPGGCP